jgi:hypothetical protein
MKDYIIIFVSSFVSIAAIMVLVALIQPEFFSLVPGIVTTGDVQQHDTTSVQRPPAGTLNAKVAQGEHALMKPFSDSALVAGMNDTTAKPPAPTTDTAVVSTQHPVFAPTPKAEPPLARTDSLSESELKRMVQIFESMDAENAAKILLNMDDFAIRQVLTSMKKRQSAKILSVLEPQQAARILKGRKDS